jgi:hypothetical protein
MTDGPAIYGYDLFGDAIKPKASGIVAKRFLFPPFSVLDARSGEWQSRKRAWKSIGLESELGRSACVYSNKWAQDKGLSGCGSSMAADYTSIFDPVLCELVYRWFCPAGGRVVDPFAGGSVRGAVASALGLRYWGAELRGEQVEANRAQSVDMCLDPMPTWEIGDSTDLIGGAPEADLVFSCPPYGDLEVYSDDPADLSAMDWPEFLTAYRAIVRRAVARLRPDRFACFVVGDFRDRAGNYRNFVGETVAAFIDAGADLYNEAIMFEALGSAAMRVSRQFAAGRKLVKVHQNVLVFVKGDGKRAATACGEVQL